MHVAASQFVAAGLGHAFEVRRPLSKVGASRCAVCQRDLFEHSRAEVAETDALRIVNVVADDEATEVLLGGRLFVGSLKAAMKLARLEPAVVVANCAGTKIHDFLPKTRQPVDDLRAQGRCLDFEWDDDDAFALPWADLERGVRWIDAHPSVVVNCAQGRSRSGALATAYLAAKGDVSIDEALGRLHAKRAFAQPNPGFMRQLRSHEAALRRLLLHRRSLDDDDDQHESSTTTRAVLAYVGRACAARDVSHGVAHALRVRDVALEILNRGDAAVDDAVRAAKGQGVDAAWCVALAALLHDVCDHKYVDPATPEGRAALEGRDDLLASVAKSPTEAEWCLAIIAEVSYSREARALTRGAPSPWTRLDEPLRTLRHVVSDADKIDALGATGLERCFEFRRAVQHPPPETEEEALTLDVARHCDEKLLRLLPDFIRTEPGRAIAAPHHAFLADWRSRVHVDTEGRLVTPGAPSTPEEEAGGRPSSSLPVFKQGHHTRPSF